jgi:hypothetical protein
MMVRSLSDYNFADWRRLRPLIHGLKTAKYRLTTRRYVRRVAPAGDLPALVRSMTGKRVLVTIAFGDAEVIDWQVRLVRHNVPSATHVIADNSRDHGAAARIAAICTELDAPYVRLPDNPWHEPSRSHGIALNWVWRNLIHPGEPEVFGFLDHDLFPTAPNDPFEPLSTQDCFGVVRAVGPRWFLWAGFCVFRFDRVRTEPLDFGQDWFYGLDTGGGNWRALYQHIPRAALKEPHCTFEPYKPGVRLADGALQWVGPWLHEVGQMVRPELQAERRQVVRNILAPHLAAVEDAAVNRTVGARAISCRPT